MNKLDDLKFLTVLYVEDEIETLELYEEFLSYYVKKIYSSHSSTQALDLHKEHQPDIIISDIDMPNLDGVSLVKAIRKVDKDVRIILLTAHTDPKYMLPAIELDISKYLVKPISKSSLLDALHKCSDEIKGGKQTIYTLDNELYYDIENKQLTYKGKHIKLPKKPTEILEHLILHKNCVVTYENISQLLWGDEFGSLNAIRCQIRGLRKKLPIDIVENISGIGYKLNMEKRNK